MFRTELLNNIPKGKENAIHMQELAKRLHISTDTVKKNIRYARMSGMQILSSACGYWFAENDDDKREFVLLMQKQAISRLKSAKPIKCTINEINGQMSLFDTIIDTSSGGVSDEQE